MIPPDADRSQALLLAQKESLELIVTGAPLQDVLHHLVRTVEEQADGCVVASIMLLDDERRLRNAAAPSLPGHYLDAIDGLPADPGVGTCCAAAARAEVVVTPDFSSDTGWRGIAHLPLALGLRGAWSRPIVARDGRVLGTFGTYFREVREPTAIERAVVEVLARIAAIAIERDRIESERARSTEELRVARDAAEAASHAKSQFLAVMSHELRTPLTGIIGHADLLASGVIGALTDGQALHARRIKTGAWHLVSLIDEILTFSRLEAGKERVDIAPADVGALVREVAELLDAHASSKGLALAVRVPADGPVVVSDAGKLRQILLNLVGNAIKFTAAGTIDVRVECAPGQVVVRVRDDGCGIHPDQADYVFEPFAQARQGHSRPAGGTGLGLTVSRRLARLLGGDVTLLESAPGAGACFALTLPLGATADVAPRAAGADPGTTFPSRTRALTA